MNAAPILILYGATGDPIPPTGSVIVLPGGTPPRVPQAPAGPPGQMELAL